MNINCPHCGQQLKLSDKFKASLTEMKPGQRAKVKCTKCATPFQVSPEMLEVPTAPVVPKRGRPRQLTVQAKPPQPPDVGWLQEGVYDDNEVVEEIPRALILIAEENGRQDVIKAVEALGYRAEVAERAELAIEKMQFVNYSSVIMHTDYEPGGLDHGVFHNYMCSMNMAKRRYIFYAILGRELNTLYDQQALAYSANIVVNEKDTGYFGIILRKAIPDYESLFGPLMEEMRISGK